LPATGNPVNLHAIKPDTDNMKQRAAPRTILLVPRLHRLFMSALFLNYICDSLASIWSDVVIALLLIS
jgi:hypothetical protein